MEPPPTCWNCERIGHRYHECHLPKKLRCYNCKKEGIRTVYCPCKQGNGSRVADHRDRLGPQSTQNTTSLNRYHAENSHSNPPHHDLVDKLSQDRRPYLLIEICGKPFYGLLDTGSMVSIVGNDIAVQLQASGYRPRQTDTHLQLADGTRACMSHSFEFDCKIGEMPIKAQAIVIPNLNCDMVIGIDLITRLGLITVNAPSRVRLYHEEPKQYENLKVNTMHLNTVTTLRSEEQPRPTLLNHETTSMGSVKTLPSRVSHQVRNATKHLKETHACFEGYSPAASPRSEAHSTPDPRVEDPPSTCLSLDVKEDLLEEESMQTPPEVDIPSAACQEKPCGPETLQRHQRPHHQGTVRRRHRPKRLRVWNPDGTFKRINVRRLPAYLSL